MSSYAKYENTPEAREVRVLYCLLRRLAFGRNMDSEKRWYQKHLEEIRPKRKRYRDRNRGRWADYHREYRRKHAARINEYNRKWAAAHPETMQQISKKSAVRQREYKLEWGRRRRARVLLVTERDCSGRIAELKRKKSCYWCLAPIPKGNLNIDHVTPVSRGGKHVPDNLVASCGPCNRAKGKKLYWEWDEELAA